MNTVADEPRVAINCPACGYGRVISSRQLRRISNGVHDERCFWCRTGTQRRDSHLRYWLVWAGINLPANTDAREWIQTNGVPLLLQELALDLWPDLE